jgi:hypothetical protein
MARQRKNKQPKFSRLRQAAVDELVASHPTWTTGQLTEWWVAHDSDPNARAELGRYLRWPPEVPKPGQVNVDPRLKRQRERVRTPLVLDLERRLAEGTKNPRPTQRVDVGNPDDGFE